MDDYPDFTTDLGVSDASTYNTVGDVFNEAAQAANLGAQIANTIQGKPARPHVNPPMPYTVGAYRPANRFNKWIFVALILALPVGLVLIIKRLARKGAK